MAWWWRAGGGEVKGRSGHPAAGWLRDEEGGQLTVLLVGLVFLILMALALGWDASNWLIGRRLLNDLADGAAVAAAGSVDVERFIATDGRELVLSEAGARRAVREVVEAAGIEGVRAEVSTGTGTGTAGRPAVTVRLQAPAASVFLHLLGLTAPVMSAEAEAVALRVSPGA